MNFYYGCTRLHVAREIILLAFLQPRTGAPSTAASAPHVPAHVNKEALEKERLRQRKGYVDPGVIVSDDVFGRGYDRFGPRENTIGRIERDARSSAKAQE